MPPYIIAIWCISEILKSRYVRVVSRFSSENGFMKIDDIEGQIVSGFRKGILPSDRDFDSLLPPGIRSRSAMHWTPVRVANTVARYLAPNDGARILDVGAGCGKFCVVGAFSTRGRFYGVEQKRHLYDAAVDLAGRLKQERAQFIHGDAFSQNWNDFTALYFYNPFGEALFTPGPTEFLAKAEPPHQFELSVGLTLERLKGLPSGVRVATYQGFGGYFPASFRRIHSMNIGKGVIEVWAKEPRNEKT